MRLTRRSVCRLMLLSAGGALAGCGGELAPSPRDLAILVIDMQPFFSQFVAIDEYRRGVRAMERRLRYATREDLPVILVEYKGKGETIPSIAALAHSAPRHAQVERYASDAFTNPSLDECLSRWDCHRLYLMGMTSACVKATAAGARRKGYQVIDSEMVLHDRLSLPL